MSFRFSILICTYSRIQLLKKTLTGLTLQTLDRSLWDVIVVDNGPEEETSAVQRACRESGLSNLRYVREARTGLVFARNTGAERADGTYLMYLDDDAVPGPTWLEEYERAYRAFPDACGAGGPVVLEWEKGRPVWLTKKEACWFTELDLGPEMRFMVGREFPYGANMSIRKDRLLEAGGFIPQISYFGDQKVLMPLDDAHVFFQLYRRGHRAIHVPRAGVRHHIEAKRATHEYYYRRGFYQGFAEWRLYAYSGDYTAFGHAGRMLFRTATLCRAALLSLLTWPLPEVSAIRTLSRAKLNFNLGYLKDSLSYLFRKRTGEEAV